MIILAICPFDRLSNSPLACASNPYLGFRLRFSRAILVIVAFRYRSRDLDVVDLAFEDSSGHSIVDRRLFRFGWTPKILTRPQIVAVDTL